MIKIFFIFALSLLAFSNAETISDANLTWLGKWQVQSRTTQYDCNPPPVNAYVTISTSGIQLIMNANGKTWVLPWQANDLNPKGGCADYMCTSGSLYIAGGKPTATINWALDTYYKCSAVIVYNTF